MIDFDPGEAPRADQQPRGLSPAMVEWVREQLKPPWWHRAANCRGTDSDLFFLAPGKPATEAKALCAGCPVQAVCLEWALEEMVACGIFGGMNDRERRAERKRRRLALDRPLEIASRR
jgi:WhiB family transcriptional regulator, redox-sensing transcriptional regulator